VSVWLTIIESSTVYHWQKKNSTDGGELGINTKFRSGQTMNGLTQEEDIYSQWIGALNEFVFTCLAFHLICL